MGVSQNSVSLPIHPPKKNDLQKKTSHILQGSKNQMVASSSGASFCQLPKEFIAIPLPSLKLTLIAPETPGLEG